MRTFHVVNIGCKVNRVEADTAAAALMADGWRRAELEDADLILVNTCTVTGEADKKCRKAVRHALSRNEGAEVLVTGCAAAITPDVFEQMGERVKVVSRKDLARIVGADADSKNLVRVGERFNTRVGIKIQDGCSQSCAYCIVRTARNEEFSLPIRSAIAQAEQYFAAGVNEVVLTGINIGAYRDGSAVLADVVEGMLEASSRYAHSGSMAPRIRLSSIEPRDIDDRLVGLLERSSGQFCRHLHIPLQSGSTKVLSEMNRPYSAEWFLGLVGRLRSRVEGISISTDIIVGFPGETDEEFHETLALAQACGFSKIHVFPYSARTGTPAAERKDQVDPDEKTHRSKVLRELGSQLRAHDLEMRFGTRESVLVETDHALTESYHEIAIPEGAHTGDLVEAILTPACMLQ